MDVSLDYGTFTLRDSDSLNTQTLTEVFWDAELKPFLDRVPPGGHVVDVGAHVGLYAGYWASKGIHVTAFEAHPVYLPLLRQNIERNHWTPLVTIIPYFLYSRSLALLELEEHETRASNTWVPATGQMTLPVRVGLPLDGYDLPRIDLIKVDAQGADLHVLLGAELYIARDRPIILIEYEERLTALHGHTASDYHHWAAAHRYREVPINGWNCCWEPA